MLSCSIGKNRNSDSSVLSANQCPVRFLQRNTSTSAISLFRLQNLLSVGAIALPHITLHSVSVTELAKLKYSRE